MALKLKLKQKSILPGFGLTAGFTVVYLSLLVLIPLGALVLKASSLSWDEFWEVVSADQAVASYKVTFGTAAWAAVLNAVFGFIVAWVLVRYEFFGKKIIDAIVDLPFALPTAVSGIALTQVYAPTGWVGQYLEKWNASSTRQSVDTLYVPVSSGFHNTTTWMFDKIASIDTQLPTVLRVISIPIKAVVWMVSAMADVIPATLELKTAYSPIGITIAMTFIGLPFVVRTLQPTLEDLEVEVEEASASLGASRWQTFRRVIMPSLTPSLLTGFSLSFARALGEYGSVIFIAGNMPMKTEITSLLIIARLEEYKYAEATALATVMLVASFVVLFIINGIQWWSTRRYQGTS